MALCKPACGLRLIAVSSVFHCLTAKAACVLLGDDLGQFLHTVQLGLGVVRWQSMQPINSWHQVLLSRQEFF